ncbi:hypothetical protein Nepgr_002256 [Nepenthes gracilis]|uniref:Diacylglycerol O-acyltransferase n=1 Tax=Nepenthes gracilis TaxID=150966 RepID=A0AAD3P6Q8_NEPGR|nr:hypothetical protein Nepgr_002256 [Nepenthes gracilis]
MEGLRIRIRKQEMKPTDASSQERSEEMAEEEPLSPGSRMFHQPDFNIHTLAIMGSKTPIDVDVVKEKLPQTLLKHPRFSSLVVGEEEKGEEMRWARTEVNLEAHIIIPRIDDNCRNSTEAADKFVEDYIFNLSKTSLDKSRPLWDLHLLNLKTSDAAAIGIFRIHHSLGDGTSLMSLLLACTRQISIPAALPTIPGADNNYKKKKKNGNYVGIWRFLAEVWWVLQLVLNTAVDVLMFLATFLFLKDTVTSLKGPPGVEFTPRRIVYKTVSLDDIKLIKNAMNAALADMMEKDTKAKWGNWVGFVLLPFAVSLRDDPLDYVREAKATVDRKKRSLEAVYTFSMSQLVLRFLGFKVQIIHKVSLL